jgi:hypothetical protein
LDAIRDIKDAGAAQGLILGDVLDKADEGLAVNITPLEAE